MAIIWGRAISGVGAAGMFVSMLQILAQVTRLEDRPKLFGLFGGCFGAASVIGPLGASTALLLLSPPLLTEILASRRKPAAD